MPKSIGPIDHSMIQNPGLNYKGMAIWDDKTVPAFEKHSVPLGIPGRDNITLSDIKIAAEQKNARGLSVDEEGKYYAVKKPSQVEGFGNQIKSYAAAALYVATSNPKAAVGLLGGASLTLAGTTIYEGKKKHELEQKAKASATLT